MGKYVIHVRVELAVCKKQIVLIVKQRAEMIKFALEITAVATGQTKSQIIYVNVILQSLVENRELFQKEYCLYLANSVSYHGKYF